MSDSLDMSKAWAWYDPVDGSIKHVTFIMDHAHPDGTEQIEMDAGSAKDILLGLSRLQEYAVVTDAAGVASIKYQPITVTEYFSKFWSLEEEMPEKKELPFFGKFNDASDFDSPIRILITETGAELWVVSMNLQAKLYVTLKNDPNYLVKTVDIPNAIKQHRLGPIPIDLEDPVEYSFYVRYHDAA